MATWAAFERAEVELAAFGRERLDGLVCFHATLRRDGSPRVHPVEPWIAAGLLMVRFRGGSPKVTEVADDPRYALHSPMDNPNGEGGEFLVLGRMVPVTSDHPRRGRSRPDDAGAARLLHPLRRGGGRNDVRGSGSRSGLPAMAGARNCYAT